MLPLYKSQQYVRACFLFFLTIIIGSSGCYSFRGISIDPNVKTYNVPPFKNNAGNAPGDIAIRFSEGFKEKIRTETRLSLATTDPDIEFSGTIVDFRVTAEAPAPGEVAGFNRLTIVTAVEYNNTVVEDAGWRQNFSFFFDFGIDENLLSIQDDAIDEVFNQIYEDVFNKAFTDW